MTNKFVQSSRRFEKNGNNVRRKKNNSARPKKIVSVPRMEAVNNRATPTSLQAPTIHLDRAVLNYLPLGMRQPVVNLLSTTQVE